jgi:hypothetical protein
VREEKAEAARAESGIRGAARDAAEGGDGGTHEEWL